MLLSIGKNRGNQSKEKYSKENKREFLPHQELIELKSANRFVNTNSSSNLKIVFNLNCSLSAMHHKQRHPLKALTQLKSLDEKIRQGVILIDPYSLEQLSNGRRGQYQLQRINRRQVTALMVQMTPQVRSSSSDEETHSSLASEAEAMRTLVTLHNFHRLESSKFSKPYNQNSTSSNFEIKSGELFRDLDDSESIPLRTRAEADAIFQEIITRKRTMVLTGRPGAPVNQSHEPFALSLQTSEFVLCCFLRLTPHQYYASREILVNNYLKQGFYKKSAAQKMLRIDVNKTGRLYDFCIENGWIPKDEFDNRGTIPLPQLPKGLIL